MKEYEKELNRLKSFDKDYRTAILSKTYDIASSFDPSHELWSFSRFALCGVELMAEKLGMQEITQRFYYPEESDSEE